MRKELAERLVEKKENFKKEIREIQDFFRTNPIEYDETSEFNQTLLKAYGTQIEKDLPYYRKAFAAVVAAKLIAGDIGENPACVLNRAINGMINR